MSNQPIPFRSVPKPARRPVPQSTQPLVEILDRLSALADAVDDLTTLVIAEIARRERGG